MATYRQIEKGFYEAVDEYIVKIEKETGALFQGAKNDIIDEMTRISKLKVASTPFRIRRYSELFDNIDRALKSFNSDYTAKIQKAYSDIFRYTANNTNLNIENELSKSVVGGVFLPYLEPKQVLIRQIFSDDVFGQAFSDFAREEQVKLQTAARRIVGRYGALEGLGEKQIARFMQDLDAVLPSYRYRTIARTEMFKAYSKAVEYSRAIAEDAGVEFVRKWKTVPDERRRLAHKEAQDQTPKERNGIMSYVVQGELFRSPRIPVTSVSANNIINCRCWESNYPSGMPKPSKNVIKVNKDKYVEENEKRRKNLEIKKIGE